MDASRLRQFRRSPDRAKWPLINGSNSGNSSGCRIATEIPSSDNVLRSTDPIPTADASCSTAGAARAACTMTLHRWANESGETSQNKTDRNESDGSPLRTAASTSDGSTDLIWSVDPCATMAGTKRRSAWTQRVLDSQTNHRSIGRSGGGCHVRGGSPVMIFAACSLHPVGVTAWLD